MPAGFEHSYSYYCRRFSIPETTAVRWCKAGAPMDDDFALGEWVKNRRYVSPTFRLPPDAKRSSTTAPKSPGTPGKTTTQRKNTTARPASGEHIRGLRGEIGRLEEECVEHFQYYRQALDQDPPDPVAAAARHRLWLGSQEALRKLRKDTPKSEQEDKLSLPIADFQGAVRRALKEFKTRLEMLPRRMVLSMKGLTPGALERKWQDEIAEVMSDLQTSLEKSTTHNDDASASSTDEAGSRDTQAED